jgi:hypothetical protein
MRNAKLAASAVVLFVAATGWADCPLLNGSFEDGPVENLRLVDPNHWDANVPQGKFRGQVLNDWPTDGRLNLTLVSEWFVPIEPNDMATVSQELVLDGVAAFVFDVRLYTLGSQPWDPNEAAAMVLIDDDVVWESPSETFDAPREYLDQTFEVDPKYWDTQPHKLTLALRINRGGSLWERYVADWDRIACTVLCGGGGVLAGDFDRDCFVDRDDLMLMSVHWLTQVPVDSPYNTSSFDDTESHGTVNFYDWAVMADHWLSSSLAAQE